MASSPSDTPPEQRRLRLLLDQGFPKPPRFKLEDVDSSIEAVHLYDFDRSLSENSTPDWYLYCRAAEAGLDALVTRDLSQAGQELEMYVLTRLQRFVVLAWRKRMDDPVREWGQLLAYLPEIKKRLAQPKPPKVVFLPDPSLTEKNFRDQRVSELIGQVTGGDATEDLLVALRQPRIARTPLAPGLVVRVMTAHRDHCAVRCVTPACGDQPIRLSAARVSGRRLFLAPMISIPGMGSMVVKVEDDHRRQPIAFNRDLPLRVTRLDLVHEVQVHRAGCDAWLDAARVPTEA